ncbi:hypothetical protein M6B38_406370 [Iris pallida]|uniref:Uncharacterized protein n=1 Tax=Iris pallida TaxID=29817 RepID=A0AAX6FQ43_IRIPA|nr:hypothetical protein M6B38_406370 [Iris pallida]
MAPIGSDFSFPPRVPH